MAIVSRLEVNHPALGTAGGAGLHASIEAIYQKIGDSINTRWFHIAAFNQTDVVDLDHNFTTDIGNIQVDYWLLSGGEWVLLTNDSSPARSAFSLAEKVGDESNVLQITNNTGGNGLEMAITMRLGDIYLSQGDVRDIDIVSSTPEDGQALVWDQTGKKFVPGASGDSSFKLQAVADPSLTLKGGFILTDEGKELATYNGSTYGADLTVDLDALLGANPADATTYYLYIDKAVLGAEQVVAGRRLYQVTASELKLFTERKDERRYIPVGFITSATTGTVWSGTGSAFGTLATRFIGADKDKSFDSVNLIGNPSASVAVSFGSQNGVGDWVASDSSLTVTKTTTIAEVPGYPALQSAIKITNSGAGTGYVRYRFTNPSELQAIVQSMSALQKVSAGYVDGDYKLELYYNAASDYSGAYTEIPLYNDDETGLSTIHALSGVLENAYQIEQAYLELRIVRVAGSASEWLSINNVFVGTTANIDNNDVVVEYAAYDDGNNNDTDDAIATSYTTPKPIYGEQGARVPNFTQSVAGSQTRYYVQFQTPIQATDRLELQFSRDGGATWENIADDTAAISQFEYNGGYWYGSYVAKVSANTVQVGFGNSGRARTGPFASTLVGSYVAWDYAAANLWRVAKYSFRRQYRDSNDVDYLTNSSTSTTGSDTTSFGYLVSGQSILAFSSAGNDVVKRVRALTQVQNMDVIEIQVSAGNNKWVDAEKAFPYVEIGTEKYGISFQNVANGTDIDVLFGGNGARPGESWGTYTSWKWRVIRHRAGIATNFGLADEKRNGLISTGTQTIAGDKTFNGSLSLGQDTNTPYNSYHLLNRNLFPNTPSTTTDVNGGFYIGANTYSAATRQPTRLSGLSGSIMKFLPRTSDSSTVFAIGANKIADSATTAEVNIATASAFGKWVFGVSGNSEVHEFNGIVSAYRPASGEMFRWGSGGATASLGMKEATSGQDRPYIVMLNTAGSTAYYFGNDGNFRQGTYASINVSGGADTGAIVGDQTSDARLKSNIVDIPYGLNTVMQLQPKEYDKQAGSTVKHEVGFIAQDIQQLIPTAVYETGEEMDGSGITKLMLQYHQLIPVLTKAIQELKTELDLAKAEIELLKNPTP